MAFAHAGGMSSMLKDGAKQMTGLEEAVLKNVRGCTRFFALVQARPLMDSAPDDE